MLDQSFIIKEKYKCVKSPIYFLNTYGHVFDAKKKKISKKLNHKSRNYNLFATTYYSNYVKMTNY